MTTSIRSCKYLLFTILTCLWLTLNAQNRNHAVDNRAKKFFDSLITSQHIPGLSAAVMLKGKVIWKGEFGFADLDNRVPVSENSMFRIGSVSKSITALALVKLAKEKNISLDAPISIYLPNYPATKYPITLRQLAGHTAGIRHYREDLPSDYIRPEHYPSVSESMKIFQNDSLLFAPGTSFRYSTYGYVLLSAVLEAVSKQSFQQLISSTITKPLQLTHTDIDLQDSIILGRTGYYQWSAKRSMTLRSPFEDVSYKWAGGGLLSNASDLARVGSAILGNFLAADQRKEMFNSQVLSTGAQTGYGLGLRTGKDSKGRTIIHHGGVAYGGRAFLLLYPDQDLVIAVTCNLGNAQFGEKQLEHLVELFAPTGRPGQILTGRN